MQGKNLLPETFHPVIRNWFIETYGKPTSVQAEAWPLIERGENVLALAPTGSGKTLTAFLSALSRFCTSSPMQYDAEKLSVLYVSPLKALNEDIKRNLLEPLAAIKSRFEKEGLGFSSIRVQTRSGDTPQSQRRSFYIHPPSILVLTPESLAILLLNPKGRKALSTVKYLVIDEIHALLGNKRGAYLSCQIERLSMIAGNFQRVSLSATVRNPEIAAEFIRGNSGKVHIVNPVSEKQIEFDVEYPDEDKENDYTEILYAGKFESSFTPLIDYVLKRIWEGKSLLVFTESRRRAERICHFLNQKALEKFARNGKDENSKARIYSGAVAWPHHGSLSKELRKNVETGLAEGKLACVVATSSLELGIDIGFVDEVVLAGSNSSVSQALQRIGRAGHGVGQVSKGKLFAFHGKDLLLAAALKDAVYERDFEEIKPIENPLDILAQLILALCSEQDRNIEALYDLIKKFYLFKNLNYNSFNRVIYMLAGFAGEKKRLRDIKPRLWIDNTEGTVGTADGTTTLLYTSGGVIANRGLYSLRLSDGTKIGELDEEFVWERRLGDSFDFGSRGWRVMSITSESVEVTPLPERAEFIPFWRSDTYLRSINLTERVLSILEYYNQHKDIKINLQDHVRSSLLNFLDSQIKSQNDIPLPDRKNITVEINTGTELNRDFYTVIMHTFRGGQINYPLSLALSTEIENIVNMRIENFANDDSVLFLFPRFAAEETSFSPEEIIRRALENLKEPDTGNIMRGERHFRNRLESSGIFGAFFREAAERSIMLPKAPFGKRTPLWIMRQRSKRLFDAVSDADGFPVTAEAWRCCLVDTFDMEGFRNIIRDLNNDSITLSFFQTDYPSPFSRDLVRQETNSFMYEYDERKDLTGKNISATLSDKVIEEALSNQALRPELKVSLINEFTSKLRRELPGWAPETSLSLSEWVKERIAIPMDEWDTLCKAIPQDIIQNIDSDKIKTVTRNGAAIASIVHREWENDWLNEPLSFLGQWLRYAGLVTNSRICEVFGTSRAETEDALNALLEVDEIVCDVSIEEDSNTYVSDRENLEMLLRLSRKKSRPVIKERKINMLVPFLAMRQGFNTENTEIAKSLYAYTLPPKLWETEIFCARNASYTQEFLDRKIREGRLVFYGAPSSNDSSKNGRIGFCRPEDLDLVLSSPNAQNSKMSRLFESGFFNRTRDFWEIKNELGVDTRTCTHEIWLSVWQGLLTSDSFDSIRKGIEKGFTVKEIHLQEPLTTQPFGRHPRVPSAMKNRWKNGAPVHGNWFSLLPDGENNALGDTSILDEDLLNRDRVRLLLNRYGILCRPLLEREDTLFSWSKLLPTMRRMELAGELVTGRFFEGINSLQFASPSIASQLEQADNFDAIYWMNALDPASPARLDIEGLDYPLCARIAANRLYYKGENLIALSLKNGKEIKILMKEDDPDIEKLIGLIKIPRKRNVLPENKLQIEKINGQDASKSVFAEWFVANGFEKDRGKLLFW